MLLRYEPDWEKTRERHIAWWQRKLEDGPLIYIDCVKKYGKDIPEFPLPRNIKDKYLDVDYRIKCFERVLKTNWFWGDAVPFFNTAIAPGDLALFAGARARFHEECVWLEPIICDITKAEIPRYDPQNVYWKRALELMKKGMTHFRGKSFINIPDLIEGLDILAALRGTQKLLLDMYDHPEHVHRFQKALLELYFEYYDRCYEITKDEKGGSYFWVWAPGRIAKIQCDFSTMISPSMFKEFVVPYLREQCQRLDYSFYHLDGPGAISHLNLLLNISELDGIQWTPGDGNAPVDSRQWLPMYKKIQKKGKLLLLLNVEEKNIKRLLKEISPQRLFIQTSCSSREEADELLLGVAK